MSNKKQSSVEWYIEERNILENSLRTNEFGLGTYFERKTQIEDQAKQMEKEQIKEAVKYGCSDWGSAKDAEQYYNERFGGDNEQSNR